MPTPSTIISSSDVIKDDNYKFSDSGMYYTPKFGSYESYLDYFRGLPLIPHPEVILSEIIIYITFFPVLNNKFHREKVVQWNIPDFLQDNDYY